MDEKTYRLLIKETYQKVEEAFDDVDPDIAEVEPGQGTLSIISEKGKIILSTQPSVRQLWLAVAAKGVAVHFNYNENDKTWIDDKTGDKELYSFLESTLNELVPDLNSFKF